MAQDPNDSGVAPATGNKKSSPSLSKLDMSQPIATPKVAERPQATETIESMAKRIRTRYPAAPASVPNGRLVYDYLARFPQYKLRMKPGEFDRAEFRAYTDEAANKFKEVGKAMAGVAQGIAAHPFGLANPMAKGLYELGAGPVRELAGMAQPGRTQLSAPRTIEERLEGAFSILTGGDPGSARLNALAGRGAEAAADVFAVPIAGLILEPLTRALPGLRDEEVAATSTRKSNAALLALMGDAAPKVGPAEMTARVRDLGEVWRQSAREMGLTDEALKSKFFGLEPGALPSRSAFQGGAKYLNAVEKGNQLALNMADKAVDISQRPLDALIDTYGKRDGRAVGRQVAEDLRAQAADSVDDQIRAGLNKLADKAEAARTLGDLNEIKVHANKEASRFYRATKGTQVNASAQAVWAEYLAGKSVREFLYPELQKLSGNKIDLNYLGRREADAIALRDGMENVYQRARGVQSNKEALTFMQYVFGEGKQESLYSRHVYRRGLEKIGLVPDPTGMLNQLAKVGIGDLGRDAFPETVQRGAVRQKSLPPIGGTGEGGTRGAGPNTFFFEVPTTLPTEVVAPYKVTSTMRFEGGADPTGGPPHEITSQVGPRAGGTLAERRAKQLTPLRLEDLRPHGNAPDAVNLDRAAPGRRLGRQSLWQRIVAKEGGEVTRVGGGTLRTTDVNVAQGTLDRLREYARNHPSEADQLAPTISQLQQQIWTYCQAVSSPRPTAVRVLPGRPGTKTIERAGRRAGARNLAASTTGAMTREEAGKDQDAARSLPPIR